MLIFDFTERNCILIQNVEKKITSLAEAKKISIELAYLIKSSDYIIK